MSSGFAKPITIKNAIDKIDQRLFLLPAIQRKFVWNSYQIEVLFDSIMRGYPINSFMFWEITDKTIKENFKFYEFLKNYREWFADSNPDINTTAFGDFTAVIDGQQRLTSIYIGLKGTFAYRLPRKWRIDNEDNIPTRWLYLNLDEPLPTERDAQMKYNFKFSTDWEAESKISQGEKWVKVGDILRFEDPSELDEYIEEKDLLKDQFAKVTLRKLRKVIFEDPLINYYQETSQDLDKVLDIFIRTNSGGQPLSFSDLLMSITTANWKQDARKAIEDVQRQVFEASNPGFVVDKDFVLKTCLVLHSENIRFQVKNFDQSNVAKFEANWDKISRSIIEAFKFLAHLGFNNSTLRSKNTVIPIILYIYKREIFRDFNSDIRYEAEKNNIRMWLCASLLKGVFSGQSDSVLSAIQKIINSELGKNPAATFPLDEIKAAFKANPTKNLTFDEAAIEGFLRVQKDDADSYPLLCLIYSHLPFNSQTFDKDHIHPSDYFNKLKEEGQITPEDLAFYKDPANWNSILNLQLLSPGLNRSKKASSLKEWVEEKRIDLDNQLIPKVDLDMQNFKGFVEARKDLLTTKLKELLN